MKEKIVESYLRDKVKAMGGRAYKFTSPGNDGVPDRLVVLPGGRVYFVELKGEGGKTTPLQEHQIRELRALGCQAGVLHSREEVDRFLQQIGGSRGAVSTT